ncbi:hypothetical protein ABT215_30110 [Streptomyces sp900105755]|uniref:hypothetical protein n=1 Tax=Streptomyces sp. 900105755 TaxID=3154389 RepID=UPI00331D34C2
MSAPHSSASHRRRHDVPSAIETGSVCRSLAETRYEVSCGTTAFGDIRYQCAAGHRTGCPLTAAVTLRNVGRIPMTVTMVSGVREGDRRFAPSAALAPGRTLILRPRPDGGYLFDILVRSVKPGRGAMKVLAVR